MKLQTWKWKNNDMIVFNIFYTNPGDDDHGDWGVVDTDNSVLKLLEIEVKVYNLSV